MKIALRMDDITPDMDWKKFDRFKSLCEQYQIRPLIGVVPINQDSMLKIEESKEDFWNYLLTLQKEGWVLAQHGVHHVYSTKKKGCFPLNALSEFAGVPYAEQKANLQSGKKVLESHGIYTDIFMAPAHSYDKNTLKALKELGFTSLTDGFGEKPYVWKGLTFYPISFKQSSSLKKEKGYTTFVIHANTMDDKDFMRYEQIFKENQEKLISYAEYQSVPAQKRGFYGHLKEYLLATIKYALVRLRSR